LDTPIRTLGLVNIVCAAATTLAVVVALAFFQGALSIANTMSMNLQVAEVWMWLVLVLFLPTVIAGAGLLRVSPWSRTVGIIVSVLELVLFPLGTIVGLYGLYVLLSENADFVYSPRFREYPAGRK